MISRQGTDNRKTLEASAHGDIGEEIFWEIRKGVSGFGPRIPRWFWDLHIGLSTSRGNGIRGQEFPISPDCAETAGGEHEK